MDRGGSNLLPALRALFPAVILRQAWMICSTLDIFSTNILPGDNRRCIFKGHDSS